MSTLREHGGNDPDIMHLFNFGNHMCQRKEDTYVLWEGSDVHYNTMVGALNKHPEQCIQMTMTSAQLAEGGEVYINAVNERGFKCVSSTYNPNTTRTIYTFMAPPSKVVEVSDVKVVRTPEEFQRQWSSIGLECRYPTDDGSIASSGVSIHGGGCCGMRQLVGWNAGNVGGKLFKALDELSGMFFHRNGGATQFVVTEEELMTTTLSGESFLDVVSKYGFKSVYQFHSNTLGVMKHLMISNTGYSEIPKVFTN